MDLRLEPPSACEGEIVTAFLPLGSKVKPEDLDIYVAGSKVNISNFKRLDSGITFEFTVPTTPPFYLDEPVDFAGGVGGIFEVKVLGKGSDPFAESPPEPLAENTLIVLGASVRYDWEKGQQVFLFLTGPGFTDENIKNGIEEALKISYSDIKTESDWLVPNGKPEGKDIRKASWIGHGKLVEVRIAAPRNTIGKNLYLLRKHFFGEEFDSLTDPSQEKWPKGRPEQSKALGEVLKIAEDAKRNSKRVWAISVDVERILMSSSITGGALNSNHEFFPSFLEQFKPINLPKGKPTDGRGVWVGVFDSASSPNNDPYRIRRGALKPQDKDELPDYLVVGHGVPIANAIKTIVPGAHVEYVSVIEKRTGYEQSKDLSQYSYAYDSTIVRKMYRFLHKAQRELRVKDGSPFPVVINLSLNSFEYVGNSLLELALLDASSREVVIATSTGQWQYWKPWRMEEARVQFRENHKDLEQQEQKAQFRHFKHRVDHAKSYPAAFNIPGLISVGAMGYFIRGDTPEKRTSKENWDNPEEQKASWSPDGDWVDIEHFGRRLRLEGPKWLENYQGTCLMEYHGSSFATAVVSGELAQLRSEKMRASSKEIVKDLRSKIQKSEDQGSVQPASVLTKDTGSGNGKKPKPPKIPKTDLVDKAIIGDD